MLKVYGYNNTEMKRKVDVKANPYFSCIKFGFKSL